LQESETEVCKDGSILQPGEKREVTVTIKAPLESDTYIYKYQLKHGD